MYIQFSLCTYIQIQDPIPSRPILIDKCIRWLVTCHIYHMCVKYREVTQVTEVLTLLTVAAAETTVVLKSSWQEN